MPAHSTLARLQQAATFLLLALAATWLVWHWREAPRVAVGGSLAILLVYSLVFAAELLLVRWMSRKDVHLRPTWGELARAWLHETRVAPAVFCWRQPFRWRAEPDHVPSGANPPIGRGVILIHGFICNRGFWTPWLRELRSRATPSSQ
jgi:triacylglycerol lipase